MSDEKQDLTPAQAQAVGGWLTGTVFILPSSIVLATLLGASFAVTVCIGLILVGLSVLTLGALISAR